MTTLSPSQRRILVGSVLYCFFWLLTWSLGLRAVDRDFDLQHQIGSRSLGDSGERVAVMRVPFRAMHTEQEVVGFDRSSPWRMRSSGWVLAPFLIVDEVAWQAHPLDGYAGRRIVVWFFGLSTWFPARTYWAS